MQVKCLLKKRWHSRLFSGAGVCRDMSSQGLLELNSLKDGGQEHILINNYGFNHLTDTLFLLGGRRSIVHWLRVHGPHPLLANNESPNNLFAYVLRKKRAFGKDLTMVAITPCENLKPLDDWQRMERIDLRLSGAAEISPYTGEKLGEIRPSGLGSVLERAFGLN